jgi:NAD(P)-dependent dehydrogenase (short-subunit alcohol dehydrogenase family)
MGREYAGTLDGRTALVTGAARGMGAATAALLAAEGARVVVADVDVDGGERTVEEIRTKGGAACFVRCDVSVEDEVAEMVAETVRRYGSLDCAVNNAALLTDHRPITEADVDEFDRIIAVVLRGVLLGLKYELRQMVAQGGGSVVNISSVNGVRARPFASAYNAAKHGVIGLTRTAALELAEQRIRVNAVCPGAIHTPMLEAAMARRGVTPEEHARNLSPMGRFGEPHEVANATLWLCSDASSFVTGSVLTVDGGLLAS